MHDIEFANEGFLAPIDRVILHEDFESDYIHDTNDLALIRLQKPVKFNENVRPVCLPYKGSLFCNLLTLYRADDTCVSAGPLLVVISNESKEDQ